jgi:acetylornithine/N-succinyldiaminopimelate aminotransferase
MANVTAERLSFQRHIAQTSDSPIGLEISHALGPYLYTTDGERYVDFISGIAVSSLGHRHPDVMDAIRKQTEKHLHVMVYGEFIQKPQSEFAELLAAQLPASLGCIYLVNSGTEANEGALKLAKKHTGRTGMVAFHNSYHGDTHGSLSVTGREVYRNPFMPLLPDVTFLDFNNVSQLGMIGAGTAAVILEPIQGEGGIVEANPEWLAMVRKRCDETGTLLIFDEIQSGFGRTGKLFAFMHYGIVPDILCMAKAMGGGLPIGGFASSSSIFEAFRKNPPLNHVTTFGGHPLSCAAAKANLEVLLRPGVMDRAAEIGEKVRSELKGPGIVEVRGKGAMLGLQLESFDLTRKTVQYAIEEGVLLGWTLHSDTLIRLAPPLIMEDSLLDDVLQIIKKCLEKAMTQVD